MLEELAMCVTHSGLQWLPVISLTVCTWSNFVQDCGTWCYFHFRTERLMFRRAEAAFSALDELFCCILIIREM